MLATIAIFAGRRSDGSRVEEEVLVEQLAGQRYRLAKSPGVVLGLAAGDVFEVDDANVAHVIERAGNLCIQLFCADPDVLEPDATRAVSSLGGTLDGRAARQLVYTVPVAAGFARIRVVMDALVAKSDGAEWFYGNVYADDGTTPLNWW